MVLVLHGAAVYSQQLPREYTMLTRKADSLLTKAKDYEHAAFAYSEAFKVNGWKGLSNDRYNAACAWALARNADSAFFQLYRIATAMNYTNVSHMSTDTDLLPLHDDKRWNEVMEIVKQNKEKAEVHYNRPLVARLDTIFREDQSYRLKLDSIAKRYGYDSKEIKAYWRMIEEKDSVNLVLVKGILDQYGWLGPEVVSERGNLALFLVIQHADIHTQEHYLPMMREAVKNGRAKGSNLALLEDRVALRQGKKQLYGSQIGQDSDTKLYYVQPLEDPDHVDQRRASIGLQPLADYVIRWQIKWDPEEYKKQLPEIEAKDKLKQQ